MAIVALCGDRGLGKASIGEGRVGWQCVLERVKVGVGVVALEGRLRGGWDACAGCVSFVSRERV